MAQAIVVNGKSVAVDDKGFLIVAADWEPGVAETMALTDGCELTKNHWEVINFLREYYQEYEFVPALRLLTKAIGKKLGVQYGNAKYLYELFPNSPVTQGSRYAGLPEPSTCIQRSKLGDRR